MDALECLTDPSCVLCGSTCTNGSTAADCEALGFLVC
jgi:hypothetical protein